MNVPIAQLLLQEDPPEYGRAEQVSPLVRRIVADNPSRFTYHGTGTFIVGPAGTGNVAIIDPGPDDEAHVAALLAAVDGQTVTHILVTHTHPDHSPASAAVKAATGATTYGFGPHPRRPSGHTRSGPGVPSKPERTRNQTTARAVATPTSYPTSP